MLNLSAKAAKKFKISFSSLVSREGNYWRIDTVIISRKTWLLCTHEPTLFTLILRATNFKKLEDLLPELNHFGLTQETVTLGKGSNRKITGSMTDMKNMIWHMDHDGTSVMEMITLINETPFSVIEMDSPTKRYQQWLEKKTKS